MGKFFFDMSDGTRSVRDGYGDIFADVGDAADVAMGLLVDLARENLPLDASEDFVVAVRDEAGREVFHGSLALRAAFIGDVHPGSTPPAVTIPDLAEVSDLVRQSRKLRARSRELSLRQSLRLLELSEMLTRTREGLTAARAALAASM